MEQQQSNFYKIEHNDTLTIAPALHHQAPALASISSVDHIITRLLPSEQFPTLSQQIQHLFVGEGNRLSSFTGIQLLENLESFHAKENIFRSLDERSGVQFLAKLSHLKVLDLSDNNISRVHLHQNKTASSTSNSIDAADERSTSAGGLQIFMNNSSSSSSSSSSFHALSRLVLSGNVLTEIPNLRQLHNLRDLLLDNNQLTTLSGIEFNLPASIQTFIVDHNLIAQWPCLVELAPFADSLHEFSIEHNPVMDITRNMPDVNQRFELRMFLALLLPALHTLNGKPIAESEQGLISEAWECMTGSQLLAPGNSDTLAQFLHKFFPPPHSAQEGIADNQNKQQQSENNNNKNMTTAAATNENYEKNFIKINSRIDKIVEVVRALRRDDLLARNKAATLIQKTFRGSFVRVKLSKQYSNYKQWRTKILRAQQVARGQRVIDVFFPRSISNNNKSALSDGGAIVSLQQQQKQHDENQEKLQQQVSQLQSAMKSMWNDMAHMRGFLNAQRAAAARVIQKFWRGYKARRKFKYVRDEFRRFASKFTPSILKIQATFRMFYHRRRFLVAIKKERRVTSLENEVSSLKQQVADLCKAFSLIKPSTTLATNSSPTASFSPHQQHQQHHYSSASSSSTSQQQRSTNSNSIAYRTASTTDVSAVPVQQRSLSNTSTNHHHHQNEIINQIATSPHSRENSLPSQQRQSSKSSYFAGNYAPFMNSEENGLKLSNHQQQQQQQQQRQDDTTKKPSYVGFTISPSSANSVISKMNHQNNVENQQPQQQQIVTSPFGITSSSNASPNQQQQFTPLANSSSNNNNNMNMATKIQQNSSSPSSASKKLLMMTKGAVSETVKNSSHNDFDQDDFDDFSPSALDQYSKKSSSVPQQQSHSQAGQGYIDEGSPSPFGMRVV